jgi:FAD/FMN-containing dehydrogenase/Fe-S oxidoreductase
VSSPETSVSSALSGPTGARGVVGDAPAGALAAFTHALATTSKIPLDLRDDINHRRLYATDASIYSQLPLAVAFPRDRDEVVALVEAAARSGVPLIPRAAGTSLAGQVVGDGLVVDTGRHMAEILSLDLEAREVRVQPGVVQDELNRYLAPHGFLLGPDTSTGSRAMVAGMIGNNSCGSRSIRYGTTREHVKRATLVLADGTVVEAGDWDRAEVERRRAAGGLLGGILETLERVVRERGALIDERFPSAKVTRRNTGYALDYLRRTVLAEGGAEPLNLAKFMCGSEGTLAFVTEATLNIEPVPKAKSLVVAHFDTLAGALEGTVRAMTHGPSAVELVDKPVLDLTLEQAEQKRNRFFLQGDPAAVLMVELTRETQDEADAARDATAKELAELGGAYACVPISKELAPRVWSLRKAGLGLLMGLRGDAKPVAFVEDTAVAVTDLPAYIARFSRIMAEHATSCVYYGHASAGELHLRPVLDLKQPEQVAAMERMAQEVAELVAEFGGSLSGEHGDGRVRSPYIETVMGPELVAVFREIKRAWDPQGLLNPGKIVDPLPISANLRTNPGQATPKVATYFRFERDDGIVRATERCNGAGACRKLDGSGGGMCPSYRATREELHTTRGRANLMRTLLTSQDPKQALASRDLYEAMSLCLSCKACASECPASVDVARLKTEFLQHYWDEHGMPLSVRAVARVASLNKLGGVVPGFTNWVFRGWTGRLMRRALNVHPDRELPPLSRQSFRAWWKRRPADPRTEHAGRVLFFVDEFTDAQDADVGRDAVALLEALGYEVVVPPHVDSGRPMLSKGMVREAAKRAVRNVEVLAPLVADGTKIIGVEPSAVLTLLDEYPDLVPKALEADARRVAGATMLLEDFLAAEHQRRDLSGSFDGEARRILLHGHCHQKALVGAGGGVAALGIPKGHSVELIQSGCCGMAGSFGYETEHHELSLAIGELRLFPAVRGAPEGAIIAAAGFSCRHQIFDGTKRIAQHPATILLGALRGDLRRG